MDKDTYIFLGYKDEEAERLSLLSDICNKLITCLSLQKEQNLLLKELLKEVTK